MAAPTLTCLHRPVRRDAVGLAVLDAVDVAGEARRLGRWIEEKAFSLLAAPRTS